MPPVYDEALCIRCWDWSETSQTVSLFARSMGIVRGLAKGSRRPNGAFSGGFELLTRGRFGVIVRANSELAIITEWDLTRAYSALRKNLSVYHAGLYVADVIHHMVRDHDPHTKLYDATVGVLASLSGPGDVPAALAVFQWAVLAEAGFGPVVDRDAATGGPLPEARSYRFDPGLGGFTVEPAPEGGVEEAGSRSWRVRAETRGVLSTLGAGQTPAGGPALDRANRLLASYLRHVLGLEPPTMPVVFGRGLAR